MSAHTSFELSRQEAIYRITECLQTATNEELSTVLFDLWGDRILRRPIVNKFYERDHTQ